MPLETAYPNGGLIVTSLSPGGKVRLERVPFQPESGWDTVRDTYLIAQPPGLPVPTDAAQAAALHFLRGDRLGTETLWIQDIMPRVVGPGLYRVEITAAGIIGSKGEKVSYSAAPASSQGQNVTVVGGTYAGTYAQARVLEPEPTFTHQYIAIGARPVMDTVATTLTPPALWTPEVKASIWLSIASPTVNIPFDWVLMNRTIDTVAGVTDYPAPWLVTDSYQHVQALTP